MTDACKARVLKTMKELPSSVDVQINCCAVLSNIALSGRRRLRLVRGRQVYYWVMVVTRACCSVWRWCAVQQGVYQPDLPSHEGRSALLDHPCVQNGYYVPNHASTFNTDHAASLTILYYSAVSCWICGAPEQRFIAHYGTLFRWLVWICFYDSHAC